MIISSQAFFFGLGAFLSVIGWGAKYILGQVNKARKEQGERIGALEKELARMPLEYQRREDAIRFELRIDQKMDAIMQKLMEIGNKRLD